MAQLLRRKSQDPGGLRLLRQRRLHPRPGQSVQPAKRSSTPPTATLSTENPEGIRPQTRVPSARRRAHHPAAANRCCSTLDQVVDVDYYMPGCPPESHQIAAVVDLVIQVVQGKAELPPKGAVIGAGDSTVCDECPRKRDVKTHQRSSRASRPCRRSIRQTVPAGTRACCATARPPAAAAMRAARSGHAPCIGCYGAARRRHSIRARG